MRSNRPPPTFEISKIVSLNALDLTLEALEQRLELSYAWISAQLDDECSCGIDNCTDHCGRCGMLCSIDDCYSDNNCTTNVCVGGNCPVEPGET